MSPDKEKTLIELYPKLYRQSELEMTESCMYWGFECPDEWYYIISELSQRITVYSEEQGITIEASQVKEKFGGLRFYIDFVGDVSSEQYNTVNKMIEHAECQITELQRILQIKNDRKKS